MDVEVTVLGDREVSRAAGLLARAFAADPVIGYYLTDGRRRRPAFRAFFRSALYEALPHRAVYAARNEASLVGAAAWLPPDAPDAPPNRRARLSAAYVRTLYPKSGATLFAGFSGLTKLHPAESHWYLMFAGVEPTLQNSGIGAALLAPILTEADSQGILCYLETPFPRTHEFYRRLGFEIQSKTEPFEAPAPLWTMTRSPAPTRAA